MALRWSVAAACCPHASPCHRSPEPPALALLCPIPGGSRGFPATLRRAPPCHGWARNLRVHGAPAVGEAGHSFVKTNEFSNRRSRLPDVFVGGRTAPARLSSPWPPTRQRRAGSRWTGHGGMSPALSLLLSLASCPLLWGKSSSGAAGREVALATVGGEARRTTLSPTEGTRREEGTERSSRRDEKENPRSPAATPGCRCLLRDCR